MSLPIMTDKNDIDEIVKFLKTKPVGTTIGQAKALIDKKLLDGRKLSAYKRWGFISENGEKLILTDLGKKYGNANDNEKQIFYQNIIINELIYIFTVEWLRNVRNEQIPATDVASHWYQHFKEDIGTETEQSLTNQVTCFMGIAMAAGLGDYKVGRRGSVTRLEINRSELELFIDNYHNKNNEPARPITSDENSIKDSQNNVNQQTSKEDTIRSTNPSLHIDIQIHIDSEATSEQIDKIFESMAKHLYNKHSN